MEIERLSGDSEPFIREVNNRIASSLRDATLTSVFVVRIRDWFGKRWLGFSGKSLGALGIRREQLTIPPFVPARVISVAYAFRNEASGSFIAAESPVLLHPSQPSERNLRRYVSSLIPSSAAFWISTGSLQSGRASFMAYVPTTLCEVGYHHGEYLGFRLAPEFRIVEQGVVHSGG